MRAGRRYTCPDCGEEFAYPVSCFRCETVPVDEFGNEPPPHFSRRKVLGAELNREVARGEDVAELFAGQFRRLAGAVAEFNAMRGLRRRFKRTPLGLFEVDGKQWLRLQGVVRLVEAVPLPGDPGLADAACFRLRLEIEDSGGAATVRPGLSVELHQGCGRFLISGEEHVFVDEDFLQVLPAEGDSYRTPGVVLRDGDRIEALGPVVKRSLAELGLGGLSAGSEGYRGGREIFCFEGTSDAMVFARPVRKENG